MWNQRRIQAAAVAEAQRAAAKKGYKRLGASLKRVSQAASAVNEFAKGAKQAEMGSGPSEGTKKPQSALARAAAMTDPEDPDAVPMTLVAEVDVRRELLRENDQVEELEIKGKVHTAAGSSLSGVISRRLEWHRERHGLLKEALRDMVGDVDEKKQQEEPEETKEPSKGGLLSDIANSGVVVVLKNSMNGFISVFMFFADVLSDIAVVVLLWDTGNYAWAAEAVFFLIAQYVVVYFRVRPYFVNTFGADSCLTISFSVLGFPAGVLVFDFLMLLEPFGLLTVLPLPTWLKQFIPAYKATRVITEIAIESLPQSLLQSYILIVVMDEVLTAAPPTPALAAGAAHPRLPRCRHCAALLTQLPSHATPLAWAGVQGHHRPEDPGLVRIGNRHAQVHHDLVHRNPQDVDRDRPAVARGGHLGAHQGVAAVERRRRVASRRAQEGLDRRLEVRLHP